MSLLRPRKCLSDIPQQKSSYATAKNEVTCSPHQFTSKEMFRKGSKPTMRHFLRLEEAPVENTAFQFLNKMSVLLVGGWGVAAQWVIYSV